jgi:hypothetical protein
MPLTANRELSRYVDQELRSLGVAASTHIYKGAIVGISRATGFARPLVAGDLFAGIAYEEIDNTAGSAGGELAVRVYTQGDFVLTTNSATQALAGAPVYATGDDATSLSYAAGQSYCGIFIAQVGSNLGIVRIQPLIAAQVEQSVNIPLASLTTGATVNPVMITQRAIKVVSAHVSFNTVPNSGNLDVGTDASNPNQIVSAFNLASLSAGVPAGLTLNFHDVTKNLRIWAKVGQASSTAGVGGLLSLRYIELP